LTKLITGFNGYFDQVGFEFNNFDPVVTVGDESFVVATPNESSPHHLLKVTDPATVFWLPEAAQAPYEPYAGWRQQGDPKAAVAVVQKNLLEAALRVAPNDTLFLEVASWPTMPELGHAVKVMDSSEPRRLRNAAAHRIFKRLYPMPDDELRRLAFETFHALSLADGLLFIAELSLYYQSIGDEVRYSRIGRRLDALGETENALYRKTDELRLEIERDSHGL